MTSRIIIWIDHRTAHLYRLEAGAADDVAVHNHHEMSPRRRHAADAKGRATSDRDYLESVSAAIGDADEILILGPADEKNVLKAYLDAHEPAQAGRVLGVETLQHNTAGEIEALGRRFFRHADRMLPPLGRG